MKKRRIYSKIIWCDKKNIQGGHSMEITAMQKILEAEEKADKIIADGTRKARDIAEKSALEQKEMTVRFEEELEGKVSEILSRHTEAAVKESKELELSFEGECEEIKKNASLRISDAVDFVIEKMGDGKWQ
ncbi:MAG TPA: hypothetical protein PLP30_10680 [Clostridia bacterium]|nr:hypothetical protein [Clostridia bacterium]HRX42441.1 hypothetical protein [Clostridia bacterium]